MIVYTAIYGGYDPLHSHPEHPDVDQWVCYTDDPALRGTGWTTIVEEARYPHPRLAAKWRKCHPPWDADRSLWIDGSVEIIHPAFIDVVNGCLNVAPITLFDHPWRNCIWPEVDASVGMAKYAGLEPAMRRQLAHYGDLGWKRDAGLYASTVIGRHNLPNVRDFGAAWFAHCELWTYQDQISLPYLLDRYGLRPEPLPFELNENPWFRWHAGHTRSD